MSSRLDFVMCESDKKVSTSASGVTKAAGGGLDVVESSGRRK